MIDITLTDNNFPHQEYLTPYIKSEKIRWVRDGKRRKVNVYTDNYIKRGVLEIPQDGNSNVLVMLEPLTNPQWTDMYEYIKTDFEKFDLIITHNLQVLGDLIKSRGDKFYYSTKCLTTSWLDKSMINLYDKTKMISMPFSWKTGSEGHSLRHEIYNKYKDTGLIDFYGTGVPGFEGEFRDCFFDYKYTIVIENTLQRGFNSEKLNDAFLTGCVPIYWGSDILDKNYNQISLYRFNPNVDSINWNMEKSLENLDTIINKLIKDDPYNEMLNSIINNYNYTLTCLNSEDNIFNILKERSIV